MDTGTKYDESSIGRVSTAVFRHVTAAVFRHVTAAVFHHVSARSRLGRVLKRINLLFN